MDSSGIPFHCLNFLNILTNIWLNENIHAEEYVWNFNEVVSSRFEDYPSDSNALSLTVSLTACLQSHLCKLLCKYSSWTLDCTVQLECGFTSRTFLQTGIQHALVNLLSVLCWECIAHWGCVLPEPQPSAFLEEDISGAHCFQVSFYFYLFLICFWLVEDFFTLVSWAMWQKPYLMQNFSFHWLSVCEIDLPPHSQGRRFPALY